MESPGILQLSIRHYEELLKLGRHTSESRERLIESLGEAQAQLRMAEAERRRKRHLSLVAG